MSYHPEAVEELGGLVPAVGYQRQAGVLDPEYSIYREQGRGDESQPQVYSIGLPAAIADALGTSIDELEELSKRKRPEITIYAVEGLLGFKIPTVHKIQADRNRKGELTDVAGIGETIAKRLRERGYESPEDLVGVTRERLLGIEGLSWTRVDRALDGLSTRP